MRRGEIWSYSPKGMPRHRTVVIVSSDGINESVRPWLIGTDVVHTDPDDILSVQLDSRTWVSALYATRLYRGWFTEQVGTAEPDVMHQLNVALRAALEL